MGLFSGSISDQDTLRVYNLLMPESHSAALECKTSCPKCGGTLFLNGPLLRVHCNSCQSEVDISQDIWGSIISSVLEDFSEFAEGEGRNSTIFTAGFHLELLYGRLMPRCPKCKTDFPEPFVAPEAKCPKCDYSATVAPAPDWFLKESIKQIKELADSASDDDEEGKEKWPMVSHDIGSIIVVDAELPGEETEADVVLSEPIVFTCPKCGGALDIDGKERVITCKYCNSRVYLPDDLWLRIHPAKTVKRWFAVFVGYVPKGGR